MRASPKNSRPPAVISMRSSAPQSKPHAPGGLSDPASARAKLASAVAQMRTNAPKRVLADALAVLSDLSGAVGDMTAAQAEWDEAVKLYQQVGHPAREHSPHWLVDQSRG
ncbi:MAG: hypothetical protein HND48_14165 [Chloroflexi bacterium]|nr:hypothetical protein [Chloroflexota bacterium]